MIIYIALWILSVEPTNTYILQDSFNIKVDKNAEYKIDGINDDDLLKLSKNHLERLKYDYVFKELDKITIDNYRSVKSPIKRFFTDMNVSFGTPSKDHTPSILDTLCTTHKVHKRKIKKEEAYDYDRALSEYFQESLQHQLANRTYQPKAGESNELLDNLKRIVSIGKNGIDDKRVGLKTIYRLLFDYNRQELSNEELNEKFWRIVKILFVVYLIVAIPLWCLKGWCCCCLCCKMFNPKRTIDDARRYFLENPPGMLKCRPGQTLYEPTDEERFRYDEFQHLLRII